MSGGPGRVAAVLAVVAAGLGAGWLLPRAPARGPLQLSVPLAPARLDGTFAVSPDGSRVAFPGTGRPGRARAVRPGPRRARRARPSPAPRDARSPFFSPDGEWIGLLRRHGPAAEGAGERGTRRHAGRGQPAKLRRDVDRGRLDRVDPAGGRPSRGASPCPRRRRPARAAADERRERPGVREARSRPSPVSPPSCSRSQRTSAPTAARSNDGASQAVAVQLIGTGERHVLAPGGVGSASARRRPDRLPTLRPPGGGAARRQRPEARRAARSRSRRSPAKAKSPGSTSPRAARWSS